MPLACEVRSSVHGSSLTIIYCRQCNTDADTDGCLTVRVSVSPDVPGWVLHSSIVQEFIQLAVTSRDSQFVVSPEIEHGPSD